MTGDQGSSRPPPGRPSAAGFTLLELVVVVAVVGVMAAVAGPTLTRLGAARREFLATRVRNVLIYAQETAMTSDVDTWVVFDVDGGSVSAFVEDPDNPGRAGRLALVDPLTRDDLVLDLGDAGSSLTAADFASGDEVQFDQDGAPRGLDGSLLTSDGTVEVGGATTLRVTRNTGLVTVD